MVAEFPPPCGGIARGVDMESRIVLSRLDHRRLRSLLAAQWRLGSDREHLLDLEGEIDRAHLVDDHALPQDVVAIGSTVVVLDVESQHHEHYALVLPHQADISRHRVSVLAPLGTALLGCRVADIVEWRMPGGLRRLRVEAVKHGDEPPERSARIAA
jgi:regulator of nucleoside diphosphate kinase